MEQDVHVMPVEDLREHVERDDCWCRPLVLRSEDSDRVVIHHSEDGRELVERHGLN